MHALCNGAQPFGAMKHPIHRGHDRQKRLRSADIRGGFLAPDMLLAGLQRQAVSLVAARINTDPHNPPRHSAFERIAARHEGGMRATIAHRHAKALRATHGNIGPHRAGFLDQGQRQKIRGHDRHRIRAMQRRNLGREIAQIAICAGILENTAKYRACIQAIRRTHDHLYPQRGRAGLHDSNILGMAVFIHEEGPRLGFGHALRHDHRLGASCGFIQKRGIGHGQPCQIGHHGLKIQQCFQTPLGNFGLIGGVGRVPCRIFKDIAQDRGRRDSAIIALPDQRGHDLVFRAHSAQFAQQLALRQRRPCQPIALAQIGGDGLLYQLVKAFAAQHFQHRGHFFGRWPDMTAIGEIIGIIIRGGKGHQALPRKIQGFGQRCGRATALAGESGLTKEILVFILGHEFIKHAQIIQLHLEKPRIALRVFIHKAGIIRQRLIHLDDLAIDRGQDIRGRLDRFDHADLIALANLCFNLWQFHKDNIAQLLGGVFGNAHNHDIALDAQPFMFFSVSHSKRSSALVGGWTKRQFANGNGQTLAAQLSPKLRAGCGKAGGHIAHGNRGL